MHAQETSKFTLLYRNATTYGIRPLNPTHLFQIPLHSVSALDTMAKEEGEIKGVDEEREDSRESLEFRKDQFHLFLHVLQSNE